MEKDTSLFSFFYSTVNHKHILTKYYNHQEHTYRYLGSYKNTNGMDFFKDFFTTDKW